jgi:hypothetical protein
MLSIAPAGDPCSDNCSPMTSRKLTSDEREALHLFARSEGGCRQSILLAHGIMIETLENLVRTSLAMAELAASSSPGAQCLSRG